MVINKNDLSAQFIHFLEVFRRRDTTSISDDLDLESRHSMQLLLLDVRNLNDTKWQFVS